MTENVKPVKSVKVGAVEAAVWENASKEGRKFFTTTLDKNYKDGEAWKKTTSFGADDLPKAILALQQAYEFVAIKENH
jgi:hypothetical protein